jgi:hypothetical protein
MPQVGVLPLQEPQPLHQVVPLVTQRRSLWAGSTETQLASQKCTEASLMQPPEPISTQNGSQAFCGKVLVSAWIAQLPHRRSHGSKPMARQKQNRTLAPVQIAEVVGSQHSQLATRGCLIVKSKVDLCTPVHLRSPCSARAWPGVPRAGTPGAAADAPPLLPESALNWQHFIHSLMAPGEGSWTTRWPHLF